MKKIFFIYILFAFMLISCSNSTSSVSNDEDTQIPTGYGILSFSIGNNTSADRTAINLDTILSKVSQYEIVIYNSTKRYEETFTLDETKSLIIEEGTYNSIIVATDGHNKTYEYGGSSLGSGYAKNITITSGKKTTVDYVLKPFDFSISCPAEVNCSEQFDVTFSFDTRNELLRVIGNGVSVKIKSSGTGNNEHPAGTSISKSYTFTAPSIPVETYVYFNSIGFGLYDATYNKAHSFPNPYIPETGEVYKNITWAPINFTEPESATGVNINISWEQ